MSKQPYIYSSLHLVQHLHQMKDRLVMQRKIQESKEKKHFINKKLEQIDDVLSLPYFDPFARDEVRAELISKVKNDRNAFKDSMQDFLRDNNYESLKIEYEGIRARIDYFKESNPNVDDDELMFELWDELEKCNLFKSLEAEYDKLKHEINVRKWLLGMIHRPNGYFEKAWK